MHSDLHPDNSKCSFSQTSVMISLIVRPVVVLSWPLVALLLAEEALVIHAPDKVIAKA